MSQSFNQSMDKDNCRTAPATPGLLIMDYNEVWVSKTTFYEEAKKTYTGWFFLPNVGQKRQMELKLKFSRLSSTLIWNAKHVLNVAF